ncbi:hypothetical protein [Vibrio maritimus]|uniref:hypothetical protein n=1 Tax=Vibrio maritimus TaxID=990268 RepID=UPI001F434E5A|nr:hypothetical protein [Vibrio maritimus]
MNKGTLNAIRRELGIDVKVRDKSKYMDESIKKRAKHWYQRLPTQLKQGMAVQRPKKPHSMR